MSRGEESVDAGKIDARIGIVGLGQMGLQHAAILNHLTGKRVCVYDANERLINLTSRLTRGLCVHRSLEDMVTKEALDAVHVCTPTQTHFDTIKTLLEFKSTHAIFVEKPLSTDYQTAKLICDLTGTDKYVTMVGFQKRFNGAYLKLKEIIGSGVLGDIEFYRAHSFSADVMKRQDGWKFEPPYGGVVLDFGVHMLDMLAWLFGEPSVEYAVLRKLFSRTVEDYALVTLRHNGLEGSLEVGWSMRNYAPNEHLIEVHGAKGSAVVNDEELRLELDSGLNIYRASDLTAKVPYLLTYPEYTLEDAYFLEAVTEGHRVQPDFQAGMAVNRLIDQIKKGS